MTDELHIARKRPSLHEVMKAVDEQTAALIAQQRNNFPTALIAQQGDFAPARNVTTPSPKPDVVSREGNLEYNYAEALAAENAKLTAAIASAIAQFNSSTNELFTQYDAERVKRLQSVQAVYHGSQVDLAAIADVIAGKPKDEDQ